MSFKVGDLAIFDPHGHGEDHLMKYRGEEVEIVGGPFWREANRIRPFFRVQASDHRFICTEICLRPLPPPRTVTTWDECIWKPKGVAA